MKILKILGLVIVLALPFLYMNCSSNETNELGLIAIPEVKTLCLSSIAEKCISHFAGAPIFIGFTDNLSINCKSFIAGTPIDQLYLLFNASSVHTSQFNSQIASLISSTQTWKGSGGLSLEILDNKEYLFCAFIDSNNDGLLSAKEPVLNQTELLSDLKQLDLENWNNN